MPFFLLAGASLIGSVASGAIGAGAAQSAADTQAAAAEQAAQIQQQQFQQTTANEQPFLQAGQNLLGSLVSGVQPGGALSASLNPGIQPLNTGSLPAGFTPQTFDYKSSPGYNFALQQGLGAVTNKASAVGGLQGGDTLKALTDYATGSASQDYQQQFGDYIAQQTLNQSAQGQNFQQALAGQGQNFNQNTSLQAILQAIQQQNFGQQQNIVGSGQNAAANLGALGAQSASAVGADLTGAANAASAGTVGAANAITGGIGGAVSGLSQNLLLQKLLGGGVSPTSLSGPSDGIGAASYNI